MKKMIVSLLSLAAVAVLAIGTSFAGSKGCCDGSSCCNSACCRAHHK